MEEKVKKVIKKDNDNDNDNDSDSTSNIMPATCVSYDKTRH